MAKVMVIMGSISDEAIVRPCMEVLRDLGIEYQATVCSAHRTPKMLGEILAREGEHGTQIYICAAGMAAHLAGAVASRTLRPVIGLPLTGNSLCGMDALFSTVQMPAGFPVATVALNGARNAAWLAAQILALQDMDLAALLVRERKKMEAAVEKAAAQLEQV